MIFEQLKMRCEPSYVTGGLIYLSNKSKYVQNEEEIWKTHERQSCTISFKT